MNAVLERNGFSSSYQPVPVGSDSCSEDSTNEVTVSGLLLRCLYLYLQTTTPSETDPRVELESYIRRILRVGLILLEGDRPQEALDLILEAVPVGYVNKDVLFLKGRCLSRLQKTSEVSLKSVRLCDWGLGVGLFFGDPCFESELRRGNGECFRDAS